MKERKEINEMDVHGREWHQWIVINVPGNNVSAGETLYPYLLAGDPVDASSKIYYLYNSIDISSCLYRIVRLCYST